MNSLERALVPVPVDSSGLPMSSHDLPVPDSVIAAFRKLRETPYVQRGAVRPIFVRMAELRRALEPAARHPDEVVQLPLFESGEIAAFRRVASEHLHSREIGCQTAEMSLMMRAAQATQLRGPAVFTQREQDLHISMDCPSWIVRLRSIGAGFHALYRVDVRGLPARAHPDGPRRVRGPSATKTRRRSPGLAIKDVKDAPRDAQKRVLIRVAVAFTAQSVAQVRAENPAWGAGDAPFVFLAQTYLCRTNAYFDLSGIAVHLVLAGVNTTDVDETAAGAPGAPRSAIGNRLLDPTRAEVSTLIDWWSDTQAQSLVLIGELGGLQNPNNYGGSTYTGWTPVTSDNIASLFDDPSERPGMRGYSVVNRACADNEYSFAHEIGHQLGMQHERGLAGGGAVQIVELSPMHLRDHGYGHLSASPRGFTIMALGEGGTDRVFRAPVFSTDGALNGPSPDSGITAWGSPDADNVAMANRLAPYFACRTPPGKLAP